MDILLNKLFNVLFKNVSDEDVCCFDVVKVFLDKFFKFEIVIILKDGEEVLVSVIVFVGEMEIFILMVGFIDKDVEFVCIIKVMEKIEKDVFCICGKLGNEKFVSNVFEVVIEKECVKLEEGEKVLVKFKE